MDYEKFFNDELIALGIDDYGIGFYIMPREKITRTLIQDFKKGKGIYKGMPIFDGYYDKKEQNVYIAEECKNKKNAIAHEVRHAFQHIQMICLVRELDLAEGLDKNVVQGWLEDNNNKGLLHHEKRNEEDAYSYADSKYPRD